MILSKVLEGKTHKMFTSGKVRFMQNRIIIVSNSTDKNDQKGIYHTNFDDILNCSDYYTKWQKWPEGEWPHRFDLFIGPQLY